MSVQMQVANYRQLALLNHQMAQQQQAVAWQANLHHALHETEQMARRAGSTLRHDPFAATVLARTWLQRVNGLGAGHFHDFSAKRIWADSWASLDATARAGANDGRVAQDVDAYLQRMKALADYQGGMGGAEPPQFIARLKRTYEQESAGLAYAIVGFAMVALGIILVAGKSAAALGIILFFLAPLPFWHWAVARNKKHKAHTALHQGEQLVAAYTHFWNDPSGGGWLQGKWAQHRFLFDAPPYEPPPASGAVSQVHVERKLVERQVVVVRCRYCKNLTPVDLPACEHCGAAGFGSSS